MKLGISTYAFTWAVGVFGHPPPCPLGVMGLLEIANDLGVKVIQIADNLPLHVLSPDALAAFAKRARHLGVSIEVGTRGLDHERLGTYLRLAEFCGAPFLRVVIDQPGDEPSPEEVVLRLQPILPEFQRAGVKLAVENHDRFSAQTLARIVEQLGPQQVGICLDTVNSFGALEGPACVVDTLLPYILNLHVKDFLIRRVPHQMGFVIEGCPAGRGRLNVPWLLGKLRQANRDVNAILELWTPPAASLNETISRERVWAEESVGFLRTLIPD
jgi:sugar phosphate isomerase/epimerase